MNDEEGRIAEGQLLRWGRFGMCLCREQRNCRRHMEIFRWWISILPCMTPSKYRPWGFLGFKNIHRHVLHLQRVQTPGEFPQLGFHINIEFFSLLLFLSQVGYRKYKVWTKCPCVFTHPSVNGLPAVVFFSDTLALITLGKFTGVMHCGWRIQCVGKKSPTVWPSQVKSDEFYYNSTL